MVSGLSGYDFFLAFAAGLLVAAVIGEIQKRKRRKDD
jgi:hypothetical protein